jgi:hypothetical protein
VHSLPSATQGQADLPKCHTPNECYSYHDAHIVVRSPCSCHILTTVYSAQARENTKRIECICYNISPYLHGGRHDCCNEAVATEMGRRRSRHNFIILRVLVDIVNCRVCIVSTYPDALNNCHCPARRHTKTVSMGTQSIFKSQCHVARLRCRMR